MTYVGIRSLVCTQNFGHYVINMSIDLIFEIILLYIQNISCCILKYKQLCLSFNLSQIKKVAQITYSIMKNVTVKIIINPSDAEPLGNFKKRQFLHLTSEQGLSPIKGNKYFK